jgi:peptidoglycan/xylan/chitin deacetylase (PgdA/CDA1 family)
MKRFFFALLYWTGLTRLFAWRTRRQVKILCYHSVTKIQEGRAEPFKLHLPEALFRVHLTHLRRGFNVISLSEYVAARKAGQPLPDNAVIITFDDGFRNFYTVAAPALARFGFPSTVFVITGKTDATAPDGNHWHADDDVKHLSWPETRALLSAYQVEIGSHTHTHPRLPLLTPAEARQEMSVSLAALRENLGAISPPLAYPHGQTSPQLKSLAAELGHSCALTSELGGNSGHTDLFALRRIVIASDDDLPTFAARVAGVTWRLRRFVPAAAPAVEIPDSSAVSYPEP